MVFIVILLLLFICVGIFSKFKQSSPPVERSLNIDRRNYQIKSKPPHSEIILPTTSEIIGPIKTIEDVKEVENRINEIIFTSSNGDTNFEKLQNRYETALYKMWDKILYYQYLPDISLTIPLKTLKKEIEYGYKYFTPEEYKKIKKQTLNHDWCQITAGELIDVENIDACLEKKPEELDSFLKFRELLESNVQFDEKISGLLSLTKNNALLGREFSESEVELKNDLISFYFQEYGVPLSHILIENGYDHPDKLKTLTDKELKAIKGFGPKSIESFRSVIKNLK